MLRKFHGLYANGLDDLAKDRYFLKFHNDSRNMFVKLIFCHQNMFIGLKVSKNIKIMYLFNVNKLFLCTFRISYMFKKCL